MWRSLVAFLALGHVTCVVGYAINKHIDFGESVVISKRDVEKRIYPIDYQPWEPRWHKQWPPIASKREYGLDTRAAVNKDNDFGDRGVISKRDVEKRVYVNNDWNREATPQPFTFPQPYPQPEPL